MSIAQSLITAEEFKQIAHDHDGLVELVRGEVVEMSRPGAQHGLVCAEIAGELRNWAKPERLGRVFTNDAGVQTERDPDSVRGPDVFFIRMERLPEGAVPDGWIEIPPDLCVEVLSPHDRWPEVVEKINEYFHLGVPEVWVLDPRQRAIQVHVTNAEALTVLRDGDILTSERLPDFAVAVADLFEGC
ncbi:MAG: Uma2 family endonuclease [Planctomycetaceae bacterium]|nr:Uma2 family endonuclease [Planctomycetaceae bacterium]